MPATESHRTVVGNQTDGVPLSTLLAGTIVGVYLLVIAGATAAITDAAAACSSWPACGLPTADSPALAVAWGHRLLAAVVGLAVLGTAAIGIQRLEDRRVRVALAVAVVLFAAQVGLGAVVTVTGGTGIAPIVHLGAAMALFTTLVLALAWHLETEYGDPTDRPDGVPQPPEVTESAGSEEAGATPPGGQTGLLATVRAYVRLTKPRLMWLLCLVASAGMALAAGPALTVGTILATLTGGVLAIGASGTFNHVLERDVDKRMQRTSDRPVVTDRIPIRNAVAFGFALSVLSLAVFATINLLAAALGLAAILFYSVVYTLVLKPNTVQNTVIGGFAGALPALIGWVAVTGTIGVPGLALAGIIFLWTPAHFYNLALAYREDYARGGFPMMPVVRGETETHKHILLYLGATLLAASGLAALANLGVLYGATVAAVGAVFLWAVIRLHRERTTNAAFRAFHASNAFLGALLVAVVIDAMAI
ncbi:Protoheme IX farnesyltransferase protein [Halorhabdus tiamatea SARL4B]|uniref:Protoheme IX farnesyltransferase n=1 Tax=Halorhabdus tiamatea SARL4B TaxID=1033806 RepID=F7PFG6_9EURY|nr:heme o synthase [Halorhabdus tiamatea]ERJ06462.1 Protoheme IX farnesyltransferase protein [Halorhabdus tiamatea SARL4B]CCQ34373.1 protoheme IX farnesyltransferase [Halorhabdus tiamatea SARL4B]